MTRIVHLLASGLLVILAIPGATRAQQGQLVDRVVAIVSGTIVTMTDARAALELGFVDAAGADDPVAVAVGWLVDRQLILEEAARYGTAPPEPAQVDEAIEALRSRDATAQAFDDRLTRLGLSEGDLRMLVRHDLLARSYVDRRFDATLAVTENEAQEYYRLRVDRFVREGRLLSFDEARKAVYEALARDRRERALADWLARLRRRAELSILYGGHREGGQR
ncbi:MAG: hypothetical protein AB1806_14435 [Acidobacteriota bacterium]